MHSKPMPEDMRRGIYEETGSDFSGTICAGAAIDDLDEAAVENFRAKWIEKSEKKQLAVQSKERLLHDCGAITDEGVTYAALILFGKNEAIIKYLPQAEIIFEYRSSEASGPANQREEFKMGFFACYDRIWELVNLRNDKQHYQEGFFVFDIATFNEHVVREAILNAVSYRNYQFGGSIFVRQFRNRLVVESPGGFPFGITLNGLIIDKAMLSVIDRISERCAELLLKHIRQNNEIGTPFRELQQFLPGLSRNQIRVLMRELCERGRVFCKGRTSAAKWFASE